MPGTLDSCARRSQHGCVTTTPQAFFDSSPEGLALYEAVAAAISTLGPVDIRVQKSQIAFRRRRGFAWVWRPGRYVRSDVPAVVSFALSERLDSPRIKQVVQPSPGVWMHHLELHEPRQLDAELRDWLGRAYARAG